MIDGPKHDPAHDAKPTAEDLEDFKIEGPLRRNAWLLAGLAITLVVGPFASRLLKTYRGIVIDKKEGEILVAFDEIPPEWFDDLGVDMGQVIEKQRGQWHPGPAPRGPQDAKLVALHDRFRRAYTGTIQAIYPPKAPGEAYTATVALDDGESLAIVLAAHHFLNAKVGSRVEKIPGSWDPVLVASQPSSEP